MAGVGRYQGDESLAPRILREENSDGEWSVVELDYRYRVCAYNVQAHGGVHVHGPSGRIRPVQIPTPEAAEKIVRCYARDVETGFEWTRFEEIVKRWRSESRRR